MCSGRAKSRRRDEIQALNRTRVDQIAVACASDKEITFADYAEALALVKGAGPIIVTIDPEQDPPASERDGILDRPRHQRRTQTTAVEPGQEVNFLEFQVTRGGRDRKVRHGQDAITDRRRTGPSF